MRHSVSYQQSLREAGRKPGRFLSIEAAEYLSGLPLGWTSPVAGAVAARGCQAWCEGLISNGSVS